MRPTREQLEEARAAASQRAAALWNLSPRAFSLMGWIVLEYAISREALADKCSRFSRDGADADAYLGEIDSLTERGLLTVLDDYRLAELQRFVWDEEIAVVDRWLPGNCFVPGALDLTEEGYWAYRGMAVLTKGSDFINLNESGWTHDEERQALEILAPTEGFAFDARMGEAVQQVAMGRQVSLVVHEPASLPALRPNRFITLPYGISRTIEYSLTEPLQPTRAAEPNGQAGPAGTARAAERQR